MIASKIQELMIKAGKTLACAESCTGGRVSATLVEQPDCSAYFLGSVVSYDNRVKHSLLKVKQKQVVSELAALEMAEGVRALLDADVAVATTGVAGPSGEPVGKVCFAIAFGDETVAWTDHFEGTRLQIIEQSTKRILERLYELCSVREW
ncbi:MAG: CinA-like protein [Chlamydiales bacterium]|nr:CinA-like protein [Chlamydiales bacterium]MCH9635619.1 CinA-like protein [Chlamydiales bacterium]